MAGHSATRVLDRQSGEPVRERPTDGSDPESRRACGTTQATTVRHPDRNGRPRSTRACCSLVNWTPPRNATHPRNLGLADWRRCLSQGRDELSAQPRLARGRWLRNEL